MLRINCPICGLRDETEFTYGGDATVKRPAMDEKSEKAWADYVFIRDNPRGNHHEYWHHVQGCRQFLVLERDTLTHKMGKSYLAREYRAKKNTESAIKSTANKKGARK